MERFYALYDAHKNFVRRLVFRFGGVNRVDNIVQDVFLKIWQNLDRFKGQSQLRTWIASIAIRGAVDEFRRDHKHPQGTLDAENGSPGTVRPFVEGDRYED